MSDAFRIARRAPLPAGVAAAAAARRGRGDADGGADAVDGDAARQRRHAHARECERDGAIVEEEEEEEDARVVATPPRIVVAAVAFSRSADRARRRDERSPRGRARDDAATGAHRMADMNDDAKARARREERARSGVERARALARENLNLLLFDVPVARRR